MLVNVSSGVGIAGPSRQSMSLVVGRSTAGIQMGLRQYERSGARAYTSARRYQPLALASTSVLRTRNSAMPIPLLPLSNPTSLRNLPFPRYASTEPHRLSSSSTSPPPLASSTSGSLTTASASDQSKAVGVPPIGHPPPTPPLPVASIPEKVADVAKEAIANGKDVAKKDDKLKGTMPQRVWATVKKEAAHYWAGTKLLGQEIKISAKLQWKVLNGGTLTRRERRQLKRTTTDLIRLVPFSVFVLVPFMEFLLPVALKLFPNMLPSTFEGEFAAAEKQRKLLRVRIEMAKFLQETVRESGLKAESVVKSDEFKQFFRKVRSTGEKPSEGDVIRVAKLFNDDITLDNLTRPQLVSMCKYININAFGTDNFLKHQVRSRLEKLRVDDMMIHAEGVDSLTTKELQHACQSRGIRFQGVSPARLREEMEKWIELHYSNGISGVLLILSRAFNFEQKGDDIMESLITTLSSLPENLINEAELGVSDETTYKQKLEVLQQQQELIEDEAEQEQEEQEAREAEREAKKAEEAKRKEAEEAEKAAAAPVAADGETAPAEPSAEAVPEEKDARMSKEQLNELAEALNILTAKSSIVKERDELRAILEDNLLSEQESDAREEPDARVIAVSKRVRSMIKKIDVQLEKYDEKVGSSLNVIESNSKGQISLADLQRAMRVIKHAPEEEVIEGLGKKLDVDQDGFVELDHVIELAQDHGLGILLEEETAKDILNKGVGIRHEKADLKDKKPKKEDIISDE